MLLSRSLLRFNAPLVLGVVVQAAYTLDDNYDIQNFFDEFEFFNSSDPTHGFVQYHDAITANDTLMAGYVVASESQKIYLGVDSTTLNPNPGRGSVRLTSKKAYTNGVIIGDIAHMPGGCGVWPAFWTVGPNWPHSGEIDIIEGVNSNNANTQTLHTSEGCTFSQGECGAGGGYTGCGQKSNDTKTYGSGFNDIGGGVYAVEWTNEAISLWFFPRDSIPKDITTGNPDPASWSEPQTKFSGPDCNIEQTFMNHSIVFNTDFCGDWAGNENVWSQDAECKALADSCHEYVSSNPEAFKNAYWLINSVKVYSEKDNGASKRHGTVSKPFLA